MEDWSLKLQRSQSSCNACIFIDHRRKTPDGFSRRYDINGDSDYYDNYDIYYDRFENAGKIPKWRAFWRKIVKEKQKVFSCVGASRVHLPYDPYSYAQNFDEGEAAVEPENLFRSFSARFADPSRIFQRDDRMYVM